MTCTDIPQWNFVIPQGVDWSKTFEILDGDRNAITLTGSTFSCQVRLTKAASAALAFTITVTVTSATEATMSVAKAVTTALTVGPKAESEASTFYYDMEWNTVGGTRKRPFQGRINIDPEATRV